MNITQLGITPRERNSLCKGIRNGKLGRWLTITSFGKVDGLADPETIPAWMLSEEGRNRVKQRHTIPSSSTVARWLGARRDRRTIG